MVIQMAQTRIDVFALKIWLLSSLLPTVTEHSYLGKAFLFDAIGGKTKIAKIGDREIQFGFRYHPFACWYSCYSILKTQFLNGVV